MLFSADCSREVILQGVRAGARGHLAKNSTSETIQAAIKVIADGGTHFDARASQFLASQFVHEAGNREERPALTPREKDVLRCIADGDSNKEISKSLFISVRTVESHRENLMRKLDIRTVAGLTKYAISKGLSSIEKEAS